MWGPLDKFGQVDVLVRVHNNSFGFGALYPQFNLFVYDSDDISLDSRSSQLVYLLPNQEVWLAERLRVDENSHISRSEVRLSGVSQWKADNADSRWPEAYVAAFYRDRDSGPFNNWTVDAIVSNPFETDRRFEIIVLLFDEDGRVIGIGQRVAILPASGKARVRTSGVRVVGMPAASGVLVAYP